MRNLGEEPWRQARLKTRVEAPHKRPPSARRQVAVRQLYHLNREFDAQAVRLKEGDASVAPL